MKRFFVVWANCLAVTALVGVMPVSAGVKDNVGDYLFKRKAVKAIKNYTDNTVLKTIEVLVQNILVLDQATHTLQKNKDDAALNETVQAWADVLAEFNKSQIFMYGPAAHYDYHKQLAIWPVDKVLLEHALKEVEAGKLETTPAALREQTASIRGLYSIKYLLFRDGKPRNAADITPVELDYLAAVSGAMVEEGVDFQATWVGTNNLSPQKQEILKKAGFKHHTSYAWEFKNPGEEGSRYFSVSVPLQELIQESTTVLEDMVPAIEELTERDENNLEYWDSIDPYTELADLLEGVENSYLGGVPSARGTSFSELVAAKDKALDDRIKTAFAHTTKRIAAIKGAPPEKKEVAVKLAIAECEKLASRMMVATPLVTADPAVEPFAPYGSDLKK